MYFLRLVCFFSRRALLSPAFPPPSPLTASKCVCVCVCVCVIRGACTHILPMAGGLKSAAGCTAEISVNLPPGTGLNYAVIPPPPPSPPPLPPSLPPSLITPVCTFFPSYFSSVCQPGLGSCQKNKHIRPARSRTFTETTLIYPSSSSSSFSCSSPSPFFPPGGVACRTSPCILHLSSGVASWWFCSDSSPWTVVVLSSCRVSHWPSGRKRKASARGITSDLLGVLAFEAGGVMCWRGSW